MFYNTFIAGFFRKEQSLNNSLACRGRVAIVETSQIPYGK